MFENGKVGRRDIFRGGDLRILLTGEDKRAFRLPVFEIFASWRETWTRITRDDVSE